jgi:hypothetical protein
MIGKAIRFGPEFTFSNLKLLLGKNGIDSWNLSDQQALTRFTADIEKYCESRGCKTVTMHLNAKAMKLVSELKVVFDDDFYFTVKKDANVLEVVMPPMTLEEWESRGPLLETLIFDGMEKAGLKPTSFYGSGHVSLDKEAAFGGDVLRYRDFFVDFFNHPGLSDGIFEKDPYNARTLSILSDDSRRHFESLVNRVDRGEVKSIELFEKEMRDKVFQGNRGTLYSKGYALNFDRVRLEIRSIRAQTSVRQFTAYAKLFEARIGYLNHLRAAGKAVAVIPNVGASYGWQSFSQFYYYVKETGLDFAKVSEDLLGLRYSAYPVVLPRSLAFGGRIPCAYWLKQKRV